MHLGHAAPLAALACAGTQMIPGTQVPDTDENREVVEVVERYRRALEQRDVARLLALAHPSYQEDGGTPDGGDDYGYQGLKEVLRARIGGAKAIRYAMRYQKVALQGDRAQVYVLIDASYQLEIEGRSTWDRQQDVNLLELVRDDHGWRFTSGM